MQASPSDGAIDLAVLISFAAANIPRNGTRWSCLRAQRRAPDLATFVALNSVLSGALFEIEGASCARGRPTPAAPSTDHRGVRRRPRRLTAPGARIASIPTGVDSCYFAPCPGAERPAHMVFSGSMDWHPNEDAVCYFADAILPRIRAEVPNASFTVVGRNPTARLRDIAERAGVEVTGTVDDVRPSVAEAAVFVVPRGRGGTGRRFQRSRAKVVVWTTVGAEARPRPRPAFLAADDPDDSHAVVAFSETRSGGRSSARRAGHSSRPTSRGRRSRVSSSSDVRKW
jgi:hypothetical protein